jgi:hypothetical protein
MTDRPHNRVARGFLPQPPHTWQGDARQGITLFGEMRPRVKILDHKWEMTI